MTRYEDCRNRNWLATTNPEHFGRRGCNMLKDTMLDRLNEQVNSEIYSAYLYFSMAGYFESVNLKGFANWMEIQAQEELAHSHRLYSYIIDKGERPKMAAIDAPPQDWSSPLDAMQDVYNHECKISEQINECVSLALKESDHSTNTMLQWFVSEQVEEEAAADDIVQKLRLISDNSTGLFLLDNELSKRSLEAD